jgi:asparagine synthase (glutamine-hydrolysing)
MCGICGFIDLKNSNDNASIIRDMNNTLSHRGPDAEGIWSKKDKGIYFGHKRLSILDLSANGSQPFTSSSGRFTIIFNGEIYNFKELKKSVNIDWKSSSDTEVLIESIESIGLDKTLDKAKGMFAFALWDNKKNELTLCRDRIGEKPLYYGLQNNTLFFASELKALKEHPNFKKEIDLNSLSKFFTYGYIPAPFSIYKDINKLLPGTYLKINHDQLLKGEFDNISPTEYWSFNERYHHLKNRSKNLKENEIIDKLDSLIHNSVDMQMISDVPIGVFLSGGIDSSLIASVMQSKSQKPINTFTIGFDNKEHNEAIYAKEISNFLKTNHHELYCSKNDILDTVTKISSIYDEPFSDSSQIPTYLLCQLAKKNVTVSLSGDGGDELFYGYMRYGFTQELWNKIKFIPSPLRKVIAKLIYVTPKSTLNHLFFWVRFVVKSYQNNHKSIGVLLKRSYKLLESRSDERLYRTLLSQWIEPHSFVLDSPNNISTYAELNSLESRKEGLPNHMMSFDALSYLPDDILVKVDRAAMGVSLETRVPLLDKDVIEFSMTIPHEVKGKNGKKWILKKVLDKYLPNELTDRPKMGFGVPLQDWIRSDLKDWSANLLDESKIKNQGYLDHKDITKKFNQHLSGTHDWHAHLWEVLMFQQWLEDE